MKKIFTLVLLAFLGTCWGFSQSIQIIIAPRPSCFFSDWANKTETMRMIVNNPSKVAIDCKINTQLFNSKGEMVAETDFNKMPVLTLQPGISQFNAEDIYPLDAIKLFGNSFSSMSQTGRIPDDTYRLCTELRDPVKGTPLTPLGPQCKMFSIIAFQAPVLLTPREDEIIPETRIRAVMFRWTPVTPSSNVLVTYRFQVWEVSEGQTNADACRYNQPIVEKDFRGILQTQWPADFALPEVRSILNSAETTDAEPIKRGAAGAAGAGGFKPGKWIVPSTGGGGYSGKAASVGGKSDNSSGLRDSGTLGSTGDDIYGLAVVADVATTVDLSIQKYVWSITPLDDQDRKLVTEGYGMAEPFGFSISKATVTGSHTDAEGLIQVKLSQSQPNQKGLINGATIRVYPYVKLSQPPTNQLRLEDLNIQLTNNAKEPVDVSLRGTVTWTAPALTGGSGIKADANKPETIIQLNGATQFRLRFVIDERNVTNIAFKDFKPENVKFSSDKWVKAFSPDGQLPAGNYTVCVSVLDKEGKERGKGCIDQKIVVPDGGVVTSTASSSTPLALIQVKLSQPLPNQLRLEDLWNLKLTNPTKDTIRVSLSGIVLRPIGDADTFISGIIVDGTSPQFGLPPGTKTITYDDVKTGNVNFTSGKWREAFTRTGKAPSGNYSLCVSVLDNSGKEIGKGCMDQKITGSETPTRKVAYSWNTDYHLDNADILGYLQTDEVIIKKGEYLFDNSSNPNGDVILPLAKSIRDNRINKAEVMFEGIPADHNCGTDGRECVGGPPSVANGKPSYYTVKPLLANGFINQLILSYKGAGITGQVTTDGAALAGVHVITTDGTDTRTASSGSTGGGSGKIELLSPIGLVAPTGYAGPLTRGMIAFKWNDTKPTGTYSLKIFEINDRQSTEAAMKENKAFFEQNGIKGTTFMYPESAKNFEKGKKYAWKIETNDKALPSSDPGDFTLAACGALNFTSVLQCAGVSYNGSGNWTFTLTCQNPADPAVDPNCVVTVTNVSLFSLMVPFTVTSVLPVSIQPGQSTIITGQFGPMFPSWTTQFSIQYTCPGASGSLLTGIIMPVPPSTPGAITGNVNPCQGSTQNYSVLTLADVGVTYTWNFPTGWNTNGVGNTNAITVSTGTAGQNGNIIVTATNACGTSPGDTLAVTTITTPTTPGAITGNASPCQGSTQIYSVTNVTGVTYTWNFPPGWTPNPLSTTNSATVTVGANPGNITVTPSNACGSGPAQTMAVTTMTVPLLPGSVTGNTSPCVGSTQNYSVTNVPGVTYYWFFPSVSGWYQTAGGNTNSVTVTIGPNPGTIYVGASNSCGNGPAQTLAVTPVSGLAQPVGILGSKAPCEGSSLNCSVTNVPGVTYTWTFPAGWTPNPVSTTYSANVTVGANPGNITVTPSNACGNGPSLIMPVSVMHLPGQTGIITGSATPCQGSLQTYSVPPVTGGGVTYNWNFPAGWVPNPPSINYSATVLVGANPGNITISLSNVCGSGPPQTIAVTPINLPAQPGAIAGPLSVCAGLVGVVYSISAVTGATSYNWTVPPGATFSGQGTTSITVAFGSISGNVCVKAINICGPGAQRCKSITVQPQLATPVAVSATGISTNQFTAHWNAVAGANGYIVETTTNPGFMSSQIHLAGAVTSILITGLTSVSVCPKYYYRVTAFNNCGNSGISNVIMVTAFSTLQSGSWVQGSGSYQFKVGTLGTGADIVGCPGQSIPITMELWGPGGGGGGGASSSAGTRGGAGGCGGGGGSYVKKTITVIVPSAGTTKIYVKVGSGGAGGQKTSSAPGGNGVTSKVSYNSSLNPVIIQATGGTGGTSGVGYGFTYGGGTFGNGTGIAPIFPWSGQAGGNGTNHTGNHNCGGGNGGSGGPGGGPGRTGPGYYNDGGNGGHGGYYNKLINPICTDHGQNWLWVSGAAGGNGRVVFTW